MKTNHTLTISILILFVATSCFHEGLQRKDQQIIGKNLAVVATPAASGRPGTNLLFLNDGITLDKKAKCPDLPAITVMKFVINSFLLLIQNMLRDVRRQGNS